MSKSFAYQKHLFNINILIISRQDTCWHFYPVVFWKEILNWKYQLWMDAFISWTWWCNYKFYCTYGTCFKLSLVLKDVTVLPLLWSVECFQCYMAVGDTSISQRYVIKFKLHLISLSIWLENFVFPSGKDLCQSKNNNYPCKRFTAHLLNDHHFDCNTKETKTSYQ